MAGLLVALDDGQDPRDLVPGDGVRGVGHRHSIANLFFVPAAMLSGADITVGQFATANLIPATLGNWVGGALLIGLPYAWLYSARRSVSAASS